ncbi:hypothetical protein DRE_00417 [Drechslerella stenobrocha 248]|uniref:Uncharacterized protein n=1 Tax=Drechslerella stenobrocha 248 TaxID=1043628 RepID=W7HV91_9PEZI|nr:hypothetical protein DRE_00417 [Drechslerella stenobrocha 248]
MYHRWYIIAIAVLCIFIYSRTKGDSAAWEDLRGLLAGSRRGHGLGPLSTGWQKGHRAHIPSPWELRKRNSDTDDDIQYDPSSADGDTDDFYAESKKTGEKYYSGIPGYSPPKWWDSVWQGWTVRTSEARPEDLSPEGSELVMKEENNYRYETEEQISTAFEEDPSIRGALAGIGYTPGKMSNEVIISNVDNPSTGLYIISADLDRGGLAIFSQWKDSDEGRPVERKFSEVLWRVWHTEVTNGPTLVLPITPIRRVRDLNYIMVRGIVNLESRLIFNRVFRKMGKKGRVKGVYKRRRTEPEPTGAPAAAETSNSPERVHFGFRLTLQATDTDPDVQECFNSILGTPNGKGPARMLNDHRIALGGKQVVALTLFKRFRGSPVNLAYKLGMLPSDYRPPRPAKDSTAKRSLDFSLYSGHKGELARPRAHKRVKRASPSRSNKVQPTTSPAKERTESNDEDASYLGPSDEDDISYLDAVDDDSISYLGPADTDVDSEALSWEELPNRGGADSPYRTLGRAENDNAGAWLRATKNDNGDDDARSWMEGDDDWVEAEASGANGSGSRAPGPGANQEVSQDEYDTFLKPRPYDEVVNAGFSIRLQKPLAEDVSEKGSNIIIEARNNYEIVSKPITLSNAVLHNQALQISFTPYVWQAARIGEESYAPQSDDQSSKTEGHVEIPGNFQRVEVNNPVPLPQHGAGGGGKGELFGFLVARESGLLVIDTAFKTKDAGNPVESRPSEIIYRVWYDEAMRSNSAARMSLRLKLRSMKTIILSNVINTEVLFYLPYMTEMLRKTNEDPARQRVYTVWQDQAKGIFVRGSIFQLDSSDTNAQTYEMFNFFLGCQICKPISRMVFEHRLALGNIEIQWIRVFQPQGQKGMTIMYGLGPRMSDETARSQAEEAVSKKAAAGNRFPPPQPPAHSGGLVRKPKVTVQRKPDNGPAHSGGLVRRPRVTVQRKPDNSNSRRPRGGNRQREGRGGSDNDV